MIITKDLLLKDIKEDYDDRFKLQKPLVRLMMSFAYWKVDYEITKESQEIYEALGWNNVLNSEWNNNCYDVINSFWTTFSFLMYTANPTKYPIAESGNVKIYKNDYNNYISYTKMLCEYLFNNINKYKYTCKSLRDAYNLCNIINELALRCHCVANFMPCPDDKFNSAKGLCKAHDYLPVMVDLIQDCINKQEPLIYDNDLVDNETLCRWHEWFVFNQDIYCLEDYYEVDKDTAGNYSIKGKSLFTGQTIDNPVPIDIIEIEECINSMVERIENRAKRIAGLIN